MDILDRIKGECDKNDNCDNCPLCDEKSGCIVCGMGKFPLMWNTDEIRKALETSDKESDKAVNDDALESVGDALEIVVPDGFSEDVVHAYADDFDYQCREKINEIINCIEKMKLAINSTVANKREKERE